MKSIFIESIKLKIEASKVRRVGGVTVSIVAFQAADSGSTPGQRKFFVRYIQIQIQIIFSI